MPLNIRELLSGMRNERPAPLSIRPRPSVRPELLMYVGFIAEIKSSCLWFGQLKFNLRPTSPQHRPAEEGHAAQRAAAATMRRVTGYFYGTFLAF